MKTVTEELRDIAIAGAERALPVYAARYPNDKRPHAAIEAAKSWLHHPSERARAEAAAGAAAWSAAAAEAVRAADAACQSRKQVVRAMNNQKGKAHV